MFDKLIQKIQNLSKQPAPFDPADFNDPTALETDWTPAKPGGANFQTHRLVMINPFRLEFRASTGAKMFYLLFLFLGIGLIGFLAYQRYEADFSLDWDHAMPLSLGIIFTVTGAAMLYFGTSPIVFDKQKRYFWKGRQAPDPMRQTYRIKEMAELRQIHALQILSEQCSDSDGSFTSYELNLVLEGGKRVNVVDHGNLKKLKEDAQTLSAFLAKPIWDATSRWPNDR